MNTYGLSTRTPTAQEVFDKAYTHLIAQNERCTAIVGSCRYRNKRGQACAVGCLIPDDLYAPSLECNTVAALPDPDLDEDINAGRKYMRTLLQDLGLLPHLGLLVGLQNVHDSYPPSLWPSQLRKIAEEHNLKVPA